MSNLEAANLTVYGRINFQDGSFMNTAPNNDLSNVAAVVRNMQTSTTSFSGDNVYVAKKVRAHEALESDEYVSAKRMRFMSSDGLSYSEQLQAYDPVQVGRVDDLEDDIIAHQAVLDSLSSQQVSLGDLISVLQGETQQLEDGSVIASSAVQASVDALQAAIDLRALITSIPTRTSLNINFVDNTTDLDKPISTVVQSALDGILVQIDSLLAGDLTLQGYIDGLTLGLASLSQQVSNNSTSQSSSISAIQSSLNTMNTAILALPTFANLPTKNSLGMDLVDNTPDTAKPISTAVQDALDAIQVLLDDVNANLSSFIGPSDLVPYSTTSQMQSYVQTQISSMQDSSEVAASIASALVGYEDTAEVTTAILAAIAPLASSVFVNDSIASAIAPYALTSEMETYVPPLISSAISDLDASLSLAISNASDASASQLDSREIAIQSEVDSKLLDYVLSSSLSSSLSTALSSYATSASVASALAPYSTTDSVSSSITSALIPYALISSVNPAIQTALATYWNSAQVNSAINTALTDYVVAEDISDMISSALSTYDSSVASAISTALVSYSTTTSMNQAISSAIAASEGGAFGSSQAQALINTSLSSYYTQAQTDTLLGLEANVAYVDSQIATVTTSVTGLQSSKANVDNPTFTTKVTTPSLQVTGGTLGANRVLTSDASGNATWQTPSAGSSSLTYVFTKNSTQTNITSPNFNTAMTFVLPSAGTWQISYTGRVTLLSQSAPKLGYIAAICTGAPTGWDSATVVSPLSAGSTQTAVTMELNMPVTINFIYVASAAITMYVRYQNVGSSSDIYFGRAAGGDSYGGCVTAVKIA